MSKTLNNIKINETVRVKNISENCKIKRRLLDIGVIPGTEIKLLYISPFKDPKAYLIRNTVIAIRDIDARKIEVVYE